MIFMILNDVYDTHAALEDLVDLPAFTYAISNIPVSHQ